MFGASIAGGEKFSAQLICKILINQCFIDIAPGVVQLVYKKRLSARELL